MRGAEEPGRGPSLEGLVAVLATGAWLDDGEPVDVLAHSLQCAALLARAAPDDEELQVAGLVHDVGTVLAPDHPGTHASTGARAVAATLGGRVAWLVAQHAEAKRLLVATDPSYRSALSSRSRATLELQGGPLGDDAAAALAAHPDAGALLALRRADDAAKVPGRHVSGLSGWAPVLRRVAASRSRPRGSGRRAAPPGRP